MIKSIPLQSFSVWEEFTIQEPSGNFCKMSDSSRQASHRGSRQENWQESCQASDRGDWKQMQRLEANAQTNSEACNTRRKSYSRCLSKFSIIIRTDSAEKSGWICDTRFIQKKLNLFHLICCLNNKLSIFIFLNK